MEQTPQEQKTVKFGAGQSKVFTTDKRFIFAMGGKRGGKTTVGTYWARNQGGILRQRTNTLGQTVTVGPNGLIAAPTTTS